MSEEKDPAPQKLVVFKPLAYSEPDVGLVCSVGVTTVRGWIKDGLPYIEKGNAGERSHKIILRSDLEQWLRSRRRTVSSKTNFPRPATKAD